MIEWIPFVLVTIGLIGTIDAVIHRNRKSKYNRHENENSKSIR